MTSQSSKVRRFGKHAFFACVVAVALTALSTYGPIAVVWFKPPLLGFPPKYSNFSASGRDFDVAHQGGRLRLFGYERFAITAIRGPVAMYKPSIRPEDAAFASRVIATDLQVLGPMGDVFGRGGLTLHIHRAGFPLPLVDASVAHVWRGRTATFESLEGGEYIMVSPNSKQAPAFPWLIPLHVLPKALAVNLAFWAVVGYGVPLMTRAWIRSRRYKPGHCATCGYDRRGAPAGPCPECGKLGVMPG